MEKNRKLNLLRIDRIDVWIVTWTTFLRSLYFNKRSSVFIAEFGHNF